MTTGGKGCVAALNCPLDNRHRGQEARLPRLLRQHPRRPNDRPPLGRFISLEALQLARRGDKHRRTAQGKSPLHVGRLAGLADQHLQALQHRGSVTPFSDNPAPLLHPSSRCPECQALAFRSKLLLLAPVVFGIVGCAQLPAGPQGSVGDRMSSLQGARRSDQMSMRVYLNADMAPVVAQRPTGPQGSVGRVSMQEGAAGIGKTNSARVFTSDELAP